MAKAEIKPIWNSSSFLVYTGGLTVLAGALMALAYLSLNFGSAAEAGWALLVLVILYGVAHVLQRRDRPLAAGIFAFVSVIAWGAFIYYLFNWWGWHGVTGANPNSPNIHEWSWSRLLGELLVLAAAWDDRRRFRFPLIRLISAVVFAFFIVDLLTAGGNFGAAVALIVGLVYLGLGNVADKPSAFWLHVVSGGLILGAIHFWCHTSDFDFAVISVVSAIFVLIAYSTSRSSWAVFGALGFFMATSHYVFGNELGLLGLLFGVSSGQVCTYNGSGTLAPVCMTVSGPWQPALGYGLLGFFLVALGMLGKRKKSHKHAAVVVEKTTIVVETTEPPAV